MFLILLAIPLILLTFWIWRIKNHWKHNNVPYLPSTPLIGNFRNFFFFKKSFSQTMTDIYNSPTVKDLPFFGIHIFHKPALFIKDRELIKNILVKDFNHFTNHLTTCDEKSDPIGTNDLLCMKDEPWKRTRSRISSVFTSSKMKKSFELVNETGKELNELLLAEKVDSKTNSFKMEVKELCCRYATDNIASVAFGVHGNSLKDPNSLFRQCGKNMLENTYSRMIEFSSCFFIPQLVSLFKCKLFSKKASDFMRKSCMDVMEERERSGTVRGDLIDLLITLKNEDNDKETKNGEFVFRGDVLVGQAATFFLAGFESASTTISFGLFELAKNQIVQDRLRDEINQTFSDNDGILTYEIVQKMEYLQMVFKEITRMYPPLPYLDRICIKDYSLEPFSDFIVKKGTPIIIPSYSIQRDPDYFPEPTKFDPERFSKENLDNVLPYTMLTFGAGPRKCIGEILGIVETKVALIYMLKDHSLTLDENMPDEIEMNVKSLFLCPNFGLNMNIHRLV